MFQKGYMTGVFICLISLACPVWSNSAKGNDSCVQRTENEHCCKFPFDHKGKTYHACTKDYSGFLGFGTYLWCVYDNGDEVKYDTCKAPIYRYNHTTPSISKLTTEKTPSKPPSTPLTLPTFSNVRDTRTRPVSVSITPSSHHMKSFPSSLRTSSPPPTKVLSHSESERESRKKKMYIILGCSIGGGLIIVVFMAFLAMILLRRKKIKMNKKERENEHEMNSYRLTEESNNPLYESVDQDLDVKSNEEQQAGHVYHELENSQNTTSCAHEYSIPCDAVVSTSDSPKISPALNDTDGFTHFNELYEL